MDGIATISGRIGDVVFRKSPSGKTYAYQMRKTPKRIPSEKEKKQRQRFSIITKMVSAIMADPTQRAAYEQLQKDTYGAKKMTLRKQPSVGELVMWFFVSHHRERHTHIKCARNRNGYLAKKNRNKGNDSQSLLKWCQPSWQTLCNELHTSNYRKIHTERGKCHCGNLCFKKWLQHCCQ